MTIAERVAQIRAEIAIAADQSRRDPATIQLCAATKMNDTAAVREAIAAGVDCCGENRVQELVQKQAQNAYDGVPVHFIGRLQTNKVRQVVGHVDLIQSVDRENLLAALEKEATKQGIVQDILLECNIAAEQSKGGFSPVALRELLPKMGEFPSLRVRGLMAIPPVSHYPGENYKFFREMLQLSVDIRAKKYDNISMDILSMGMSGDFQDAIAAGSNLIRLGTAIFGPRPYALPHQP